MRQVTGELRFATGKTAPAGGKALFSLLPA